MNERIFRYEQAGPGGQPIRGTLRAPDADSARKRLEMMRIPFQKLEEIDPNKPDSAPASTPIIQVPKTMIEPSPQMQASMESASVGQSPVEDMKRIHEIASKMNRHQESIKETIRKQRFLYGAPTAMDGIINTLLEQHGGVVKHMQLINTSAGDTMMAVVVEFDSESKEKANEANVIDHSPGLVKYSGVDRVQQRRPSEDKQGSERPDGGVRSSHGEGQHD